MPCYHPLTGYRPQGGGPVIFENTKPDHNTVTLPCGQCSGCKLARSREAAARCMHEAQMHKHNCMVTLTYDDQHLPQHGTLVPAHFTLFLRRLKYETRKQLADPYHEIRFYMSGEYTEYKEPTFNKPAHPGGRPHYHAILFNINFYDRIYLGKSPAGSKLWHSPTLTKIWGHGYASVGDVTFESAAYVAR